jgi:uncharacterized protein YdgA (DUF945 family)
MKKSTGVAGIVIVLGIAYVGASWYIGKQAQTAIGQAVAQTNQRLVGMLGPDLGGNGPKVVITDYQRHIFSSDVVYSLELKDSNGKLLVFKLKDHLQHGPLPFDAVRSGDLTPMMAQGSAVMVPTTATQKWFDSLKGESPVTATTRVGFAGTAQSTWKFKPLSLSEGKDTLEFGGGAVEVKFSNSFKDSTASGLFASFHVIAAANSEDLLAKGIKFNSATTTLRANDVQLKSDAAIDDLVMASGLDPTIHIKTMKVGLSSVRANNLLDGALHYDFGQVAIGQADLGHIAVAVKGQRLDTEALAALRAEYEGIKAKHHVKDDEDFLLTDAESVTMHARLAALLASDPSVSIDSLVWENDKGRSAIALNVDLMRPADKTTVDTGLDALLAQIVKRVNLNLSISRPMFIQAVAQSQSQPGSADNEQADQLGGLLFDQYAGRLRQLGLIKMDKDNAVSAIQYENAMVVANGQKMTVPQFIQRVLGLLM